MILLQCSKCKDWLCPTDFALATKTKRGRKSRCKECSAPKNRAYNASSAGKTAQARYKTAHPEKIHAYNVAYYATHQTILLEDAAEYRENNRALLNQKAKDRYHADPEPARARATKRYYANREEFAAYWAQYYAANSKALIAKQQRYYAANRDEILDKAHDYRIANLDKIKAREARYNKEHPEKAREASIRRYARQMGAPNIEKIDRQAIYERDRWVCQLCHKRVFRKYKSPHPKSASLDHVIALSERGDHTHQNQVLVHRGCNSQKGNRHKKPQQQRLFG